MKITKHRDLTLVDINEDQMLVISCDSSAALIASCYKRS